MVNNMNMKQIFITLLIITIYAVDLSAQSKPKRDVSKDKSYCCPIKIGVD